MCPVAHAAPPPQCEPCRDPQRPACGKCIGISPLALQTLLSIAGVACCVAMSMPQVHIVAYCSDLGYGVARGADMLAIMMAFGIVSRIGSGSSLIGSAACVRCC